jgi:hypothetical protein
VTKKKAALARKIAKAAHKRFKERGDFLDICVDEEMERAGYPPMKHYDFRKEINRLSLEPAVQKLAVAVYQRWKTGGTDFTPFIREEMRRDGYSIITHQELRRRVNLRCYQLIGSEIGQREEARKKLNKESRRLKALRQGKTEEIKEAE